MRAPRAAGASSRASCGRRMTSVQPPPIPMKFLLSLTVILAVSFATFAAAGDRSDDAKAVQGTWLPVKGELAGQPMPDAVLKTIRLVLADGKYTAYVGDEPDKGTYTLDAASKPKSMTITGTEGPNHGKTFPAIYE